MSCGMSRLEGSTPRCAWRAEASCSCCSEGTGRGLGARAARPARAAARAATSWAPSAEAGAACGEFSTGTPRLACRAATLLMISSSSLDSGMPGARRSWGPCANMHCVPWGQVLFTKNLQMLVLKLCRMICTAPRVCKAPFSLSGCENWQESPRAQCPRCQWPQTDCLPPSRRCHWCCSLSSSSCCFASSACASAASMMSANCAASCCFSCSCCASNTCCANAARYCCCACSWISRKRRMPTVCASCSLSGSMPASAAAWANPRAPWSACAVPMRP
mmetsp:Transcript_99587/g.321075  ORF Transcript_99587/g.321075 Transcript_99587/m.321075 type:complete len:276 (+) Transcript_99587:396-1223(+)